jgi:hypothetical protein
MRLPVQRLLLATRMRAPALASVLLLAACSMGSDDKPGYECEGKCDGPSNDPLWTDKVFAETANVLGRERGVSFRYAIDRAVSSLGGFNVQPYPGVSCNSGSEQLFWNGEDHALVRLGIVGLANIVALEAISHDGPSDYHAAWLSGAYGGDGDAKKALDIIAALDSPKLLLTAVEALAHNGNLSVPARRTLLAFEAAAYDTKQFRTPALALKLPDLAHPVSMTALLDQLRASPATSYRVALAQMLAQTPSAATASEVDALLADPDVSVRIAAMPLFWHGSNVTPQRQDELLAWIEGAEAKRQLRLKFLGASTDAEAAGWAPEPAGFVEYLLEERAEFVGGALRTAEPSANIRTFLSRAAGFQHISNLVEDSVRVALASTVLSAQEKEQTLLALLPAANNLRDDGIPNTAALEWRLLARAMLEASRPDLVTAAASIYTPATVDRAALDAKLKSTTASVRLDGVKALAAFEPGFMAAVFDAGAGTDALLANQGGFVLSAALDNGTPAQVVIDHVLGLASTHFGDSEPYLEIWNGSEVPYVYALEKAIASPTLSATERVDAIVAFAHVISPRNTYAPTGAPGPGAIYLGQQVMDIFSLLDDPQISAAVRAQAWRDILVRGTTTKLRNHLLDMTPDHGPIRTLVQGLVRPNLVVTATTCWQGHADPANERPGLYIGSIPFALALATAPVDPEDVVEARIDTLRTESAAAAALPASTTASDLLATHPIAKSLYFGGQWSHALRENYELPAADLVARFATVSSADLWNLTTALALSRDFDQLPAASLAQVESTLASRFPTTTQPAFMLRLARGEGYDALASRFRGSIPLRWDLADLARPSGEIAALERLLSTAERTYGVVTDLTYLVARTAGRAAISDALRLSLAGASADGWNYWTTSIGPLGRVRGSLLETAVLAGAAYHIAQPQPPNPAPATMFSDAVSDPRVSSDAALHLAWLTLSAGRFRPASFGDDNPATITLGIDMTLGVMARPDVSAADKAALGKALSTVLQ